MITPVEQALCSLWQSAYQSGHEDTVEGRATPRRPDESGEFLDDVRIWLEENKEFSRTLGAGQPVCPNCDGRGGFEIDTGGVNPDGSWISHFERCDECGGRGVLRPTIESSFLNLAGQLVMPKLNGVEIRPNVTLIGEPEPVPGTNLFRCLANVAGALCLIELSAKFFKAPQVEGR